MSGKLHLKWFFLLGSGAIFLLLLAGTFTEDEKNLQSFKENYKVHSLNTPDKIKFAGEIIQLNETDLKERYDKEILTNIYWQSQTLLFIKRAHKYFPVIEKILKENGIPDDFKYLAVAESGLQYYVVSPSNAAGYWQFIEPTAKRYGLTINEEVDERYHLTKSTLAACAYFKDAYAEFNNWALVAAAYNMGIEGVKKQLQIQKVNNFTDLYLNTETARYVFRILAIKSILENPNDYGFMVPFEQLYQPENYYHIRINQSIFNLAAYANDNGITYKTIKLHNPWLRKNQVTVSGNNYVLEIPKSHLASMPYVTKFSNDSISLEDTRYTVSDK